MFFSITSVQFDEFFGFTDDEVAEMLKIFLGFLTTMKQSGNGMMVISLERKQCIVLGT